MTPAICAEVCEARILLTGGGSGSGSGYGSGSGTTSGSGNSHEVYVQDDSYGAEHNGFATGNVGDNDSYVDTWSLVSPPLDGTLQFNPDGSFSYTPNQGYSGSDRFVYEGSNNSDSAQATVTITVDDLMLDGEIEINLAYGNGLSIDSSPPDQLTPEFTYQSFIPFEVLYSLGYTTNPQQLRIWSADGTFEETLQVSGGTTGIEQVELPAIEGGVTLLAQLIDPEVGPWTQANQTETTEVTEINFRDLGSGIPAVKQKVMDKIDSQVGSETASRIESNINRQDLYNQNHTDIEIDFMIHSVADVFGKRSADAFGAGWDQIKSLDSPLLKIRTGANDPGKSGIQSLISSLPQAMSNGIQSLMEVGETIDDAIPDFIEYELATPDTQVLLDAFTQGLETGSVDHIDEMLEDMVAVKRIGIIIPLDFSSAAEELEGNIMFVATDITYGGHFMVGVSGDIKLTRPVTIGIFDFEVFHAVGSWMIDPVTHQQTYSTYLRNYIIWPSQQ